MRQKRILKSLILSVLLILITIVPAFAESYIILSKSDSISPGAIINMQSTEERLSLSGVQPQDIQQRYENLKAVKAELDAEEAKRLSEERPDLVIIRSDLMLHHSQEPLITSEPAPSGTPWHVLKAKPLSDYAALSGADFSSLLIFVLDTGVDADHPALVNSLEMTYARHFYGGSSNNTVVSDDKGHGTQVAGTIIGTTTETAPQTGVAPRLKVVPIKVSEDGKDLTIEKLTAACNYIMGLKQQVELSNINFIINLSYNAGPYGSAHSDYAPFFDELFTSLGEKEILFVSSAGNEKTDSDILYVYPTRNEASNYVAAASVKSGGLLSWFSNYGDLSVEVAAPGSSIYTTDLEGSYGTVDGTSFASPFTAGIAGLIWALEPELECWEVRNLLINAIGRQDLQSNFIKEFSGAEGDYLGLMASLDGSAYETEEVEVIAGKALFPLIITNSAYAPNPGNGEEHVSFERSLSWETVVEGASFDLYFGTSRSSLDLVSSDLAVTSMDLSDIESHRGELLSYDADYYWRVNTTISSTDFASGDIWRFKTISLKPYDNFPLDGTSEMETEVSLAWNYDIEGSTFDVYFSTDIEAIQTLDPESRIASDISISAVKLDGLDYDTTYYWRVVMHSDIQNRNTAPSSKEGEIMSFTTKSPSQTDPDTTGGGGGGCNVITGLPGILLLGAPLLLLIKRR